MSESAEYDEAAGGDSVLELSKTRLRVRDGELQRRNAQGGVALRLPLADIEAIEWRYVFDPMCLVFMAMGSGVGAIGRFLVENNTFSGVLYVASVLMIGFGAIGLMGTYIVVQSGGKSFKIQCSDMNDEGEGFVASVEHMLRGARR